jgi:ATP-binding cassette subfamily B (MDR/TAP) protein 1
MRKYSQKLEKIEFDEIVIIKEKIQKRPSILWLYFNLCEGWTILLFIFASLASLASGIFAPIFIYNIGYILNGLSPKNTENEIITAFNESTLGFLWWGLAMFFCFLFHIWLWQILNKKLSIKFKEDFFDLIFLQDLGWFNKESPLALVTKVELQMFLIQEGIAEYYSSFCHNLSMFITSAVIGFITEWKLTLVLCGFAPILVVAFLLLNRPILRNANEIKNAQTEMSSMAEEILFKIKTVFTFANFLFESKRYEQKVFKVKGYMKYKYMWMSISSFIYLIVLWGVVSLGVWFGSRLIYGGATNGNTGNPLGAGDIAVVIICIRLASLGFASMIPNFEGMRNLTLVATDYYTLKNNLKTTGSLFENTNEILADQYENIRGFLKIKINSFSYPEAKNKEILKNIDLDFHPGTISVIVGESGAGKSTLFNLIERFYNLNEREGSIEIDGFNINNFDKFFLRKIVSFIPSEPVIINIPIYRNVLMGRNPQLYTLDKIKEACVAASADEFIDKLDGKYDYLPGYRGESLSQGERQRISLARGILAKPRILLLDEPTSFLDYDNEKKIIKVIQDLTLKYNLTTIIISHKLSVIRKGTRIITMKKGEVLEVGEHIDLVRERGYYASLVKNQLLKDAYIQHKTFKSSSSKMEVGRLVDTEYQSQKQIYMQNGEILGANHLGPKDNPEEKKVSKWSIFSKHKAKMAIIITCTIINGASYPAFAVLMAKTADALSLTNTELMIKQADFYSLMFLVIAIGTSLTSLIQSYLFLTLGETILADMKILIFEKFLRLDMSFYDKEENKPGKLLSSLEIETSVLHSHILGIVVGFTHNLSNLICGLTIGLVFGFRTTLILIGFLPFFLLAGYLYSKLKQTQDLIEDEDEKASYNYLSQLLMHSKIIIIYNSQTNAKNIFSKYLHNEKKTKLYLRSFGAGVLFGITIFISFAIYAAVFYAGGTFIVDKTVNFSSLMFAIIPVLFSAFTAFDMLGHLAGYNKSNTTIKEIFKLLNEKSLIDPFENRKLFSETNIVNPFKGGISFLDVVFKYPIGNDRLILNGLSFKIRPGSFTAFVGFSGNGKSTIFSLILRFYDPISGEIRLDNTRLKETDIISYRHQIGAVLQDSLLFNRSVKENIRYGDLDATDEEIDKLAEKTLIKNLLDHQETDSLSQGEKQRIIIARALIRKPKLLLLDEPTSYLDESSTSIIMKNIIQYSRENNITCILIAEKLKTVEQANVIFFINEGTIIEKGNHYNLLDLDGKYSYLYNQKKMLEDGNN